MVVRRPPGRRAQILAVAADRFHRSGYHQVSMTEVAAGVGITAPALYRHFRGKPELLDRAVRLGLDALADGLRTADSTDALAAALAAVAVGHRPLGTLVQRDARLLAPARRASLRRELRADTALMAAVLRAERPELPDRDAELLCWSALSACAGLSYQSAAPQPRRAEAVLRELVAAVLAVSLDGTDLCSLPADGLGEAGGEMPVTPGPRPQARREELLVAAVRLFHERGFDNVSTDQLGAAVGITGPSVYRHFDSKAQLLAASLVRSRERLWHEVDGAISAADGPAAALEAGLAAYVGFARRNGDYLGAMLSETERLAPSDRRVAVDFRRDFLRTWVGLLRLVRPECDAVEARIRVHALFALVNDGVRNRPHSARPDLGDCLLRLGRAVLGVS
ncbi:TetR/AcrR family transcriptional regulator [Streptomyces kaniharaensis]|uniref:TetR/AcrR family transcriptional regulator n=1 Tax=Streptomyces kaniharaensis TaxID=212423 RepID=A0A6N7KRP0_9ACTN|nr:TetR/AcrR family transcriptional regulator [Streptomyces kaniharaensis]MQS13465.1 TetR/AcrR family transcriptional regulator [Streptomyces kaniharaensis]